MRLKWARMVGVEDELWRNVMSWWADIPVTGHVGMPVDRGYCFESYYGNFKENMLPNGKPNKTRYYVSITTYCSCFLLLHHFDMRDTSQQ